ncbi:MAG: glycosyltransferase family 1 protein [Armatimonadetes bacterium]|nr:glycosyltransferase family 1 protein [Armatimonadota bacterium]
MRDTEHTPRVLIGGDWTWPTCEAALATGFRELGCEAIEFRQPIEEDALGFPEAKLRLTPFLKAVNTRFLSVVEHTRPDIVFLQRCDLILPESIRAVRRISPASRVFQFHNDDPYRGLKDRFKWRHFLGSLAYADATFVFRPVNVEDARRLGAPVVEILLPYYVKSLHYPVPDRVIEYDVVFIGNCSGGGRAETIEALARAGLRVGLFGYRWNLAPKSCSWVRSQSVLTVRGDEYRQALSRARMALVLLAKINRDVWTTRCFEIPACKVAMLAPDNKHLRGLFGEREAIYYREDDIAHLVDQAVQWSRDPEKCNQVAEAGWRRCMRDGHSEGDRARQIIRLWEQTRRR